MTSVLSRDDIARYSRQLILPEVGRPGQERLKQTSVLVVGAGGLGSPCALYLAAAGVGVLGLLDYDHVDESNLQRQIIHSEDAAREGLSKVSSACNAIARLNSHVRCVPHETLLTNTNALDILRPYDIIVDATDNVATRYLLSDACVLLGKPLVSGSALRLEGQLTVYNYQGGPCYRCLFPTPPPPETVANCVDGGVLGPVTGVIGTMQAMEVLKIAMGQPPSFAQKLLLFDAGDGSFRHVKLRPRNPDCLAGRMTQLINYDQFCGAGPHDKTPTLCMLPPEQEITPKVLAERLAASTKEITLVDVRPPPQFGICALPNSINIPLAVLSKRIDTLQQIAQPGCTIVMVCRRGNDSQLAVRTLEGRLGDTSTNNISVVSLAGGLERWADDVDPSFPKY